MFVITATTWNTIDQMVIRLALLYPIMLRHCVVYTYTWASSSRCINLVQSIGKLPSWLYAHLMLIDNWLACRMFSLEMILDWWVDSEETIKLHKRSWIGSNHCCCFSQRPYIEWSCRMYMEILSEKSLVLLGLQVDIVLVRIREILCHIRSMTLTVMNRINVSFNPRSCYMNWSI